MTLKGKKILITCGPTWVALDSMRVISNRSTGELGHMLAKALNASKSKVTLLEGPVTHAFKPAGVKVLKFCFFEELTALLNEELKKGYDCVIHAAAVSDFKPENSADKKIKSDSKISLKLVPLPKLIHKIKSKAPDTFLVGFKLESFLNSTLAVRETKALFSQAKCDLVVANFMKSGGYEALLLDADKSLLGKAKNKSQLVRLLIQNLKNSL
jgi:phosphopantothenoylcysteine synthetase/decarboxylase